ncbi:MAG: S9 family peptidase, partial [Pseudomonadales bacterium]|nr:S9 family peptidase [Pseudomonadales bacterium]
SRSHPEAAMFRQLLDVFAGSLVLITSATMDGRFWVVRTSTDTNPGIYHLLDREKNEIKTLFLERPDVEPSELAVMKPIQFESFDGAMISGYYTEAKAHGKEPAPLVVLIHGGPGVRDYWGYDGEVQSLATNGFSVLQVNYRGSTGYGSAFEHAGDRHWGDNVERDIMEATRWAIDQGYGRSGHVCVMGASFGAYAAVQSATLEPDMYACVVANAGIYDLSLLYTQGDIEEFYFGESFLEEKIGRDEETLKRFSPVYGVARLKAPIFIAHGAEDERAPLVHAERLRKALDDAHKPYEWFVRKHERHGFYDIANRVEFLEAAIAFMHKHI